MVQPAFPIWIIDLTPKAIEFQKYWILWQILKIRKVDFIIHLQLMNFEGMVQCIIDTFTLLRAWYNISLIQFTISRARYIVSYWYNYNFEGMVQCINDTFTMVQWYHFNTFTISNLGFLPFHRLPCIVAAPRGQSAFPLKKERKFNKICKTEERRKIKKTWKTLSKEKSCCKGWRGVVSEITRCLIKFDMWLSDEKMIAEVEYALL